MNLEAMAAEAGGVCMVPTITQNGEVISSAEFVMNVGDLERFAALVLTTMDVRPPVAWRWKWRANDEKWAFDSRPPEGTYPFLGPLYAPTETQRSSHANESDERNES